MNRNNHSNTAEDISFIRAHLDRPIVIVGMMGVGKTHAGAALAESLGLEFFDTDALIEAKMGRSVAEIFETSGEEKFRASEAETVQQMLDKICVIATGGGAVVHEGTRRAILQKSFSVWLRADSGVLAARLKNSETRPLLQNGDIRSVIDRLTAERQTYYEQADVTVDAVEGSIPQTVENIIKSLAERIKKG